MQLYLTTHDPSNSSYCAKAGKIVYKVACPTVKRPQTATIWRALQSLEITSEATLWAEKHFGIEAGSANQRFFAYPPDETMNLEPRASTTSQDEQLSSWEGPPTVDDYQRLSADTEADAGLAKIAEIELHTISSTIIRHLGNEWKTSDFFRKEDWSWYGSDRIFKGVDGKEYKWKMGSTVCELFLIDGDPKEEHGKAHVLLLVARFNAQSSPMQAPSSLEIFPAGSDMEDWILITFVYIELLRNGRRLGLSKPQAIAARASEEQSPNNSSDKHRHTNTPW